MYKPSKSHVVKKLVMLAQLYPALDYVRGPGQLLMKKLDPEERAVAETLTADDFQHWVK